MGHRAWLDGIAFVFGLGLAWGLRWNTTDLVWSLWLSSVVVGYATTVWSIFGPLVFFGSKACAERGLLVGTPKRPAVLGVAAMFLGGLFLLAFFTVHFGMFHFVHAVFLQGFFPVKGEPVVTGTPPASLYCEVFQRYWVFLPAAFLAERRALRFNPAPVAEPPDTSVKAAAMAARKARNAKKSNLTGMMAPYKNVIRMHLLIFFSPRRISPNSKTSRCRRWCRRFIFSRGGCCARNRPWLRVARRTWEGRGNSEARKPRTTAISMNSWLPGF